MTALTSVCDLKDAALALRKDEAAGSIEAVELKSLTYLRDSELGSLNDNTNGRKYELNGWSAKQLCKTAGIPFSVWSKISGKLAQDLTLECILGVKDQHRKLVLRTYGTKTIIRGIVPLDYPDIRNSEILEALMGKLTIPHVVQSAGWLDAVATPWLRTRIIFTGPDYEFKKTNGTVPENINLALDITSSEVGGGDLMVNVLAFQEVCTNGLIATYGMKPYFVYNYSPGISFDIPAVMGEAIDRAANDMPRIAACVQNAIDTPMDLASTQLMLAEMQKEGTINKGIVVKSLAAIEGGTPISSLWDVVNLITKTSQAYRDELRLRYERVGGSLIGMKFDRRVNRPEENFSQKAPTLMLPAQATLTP